MKPNDTVLAQRETGGAFERGVICPGFFTAEEMQFFASTKEVMDWFRVRFADGEAWIVHRSMIMEA